MMPPGLMTTPGRQAIGSIAKVACSVGEWSAAETEGCQASPREEPHVKYPAPWLIQVYEMADVAGQQAAGSVLSSMPGLTLDARTCERGSFLVVECSDATQAMAVYELVTMADPNAELIYSTREPSEAQAVRNRLADAGPVSEGDLLDA
jgi:hypothetical protein